MNEKRIPQKGDIWIVDYNYKPKKEETGEIEIESKIKKFRPSLVVSNNEQNEFDEEIIVAPLSSQRLGKILSFEAFILKNRENGLENNSKVLLNRLRSIEKNSRLKEYCGKVNEEIIKEIKEKLKWILDLID